MLSDHLKTCDYCRNEYYSWVSGQGRGITKAASSKPTISVKSASSYQRERKLSELASIIKGVSYPGISYVGVKKTNDNTRTKTKGASSMDAKAAKLRDLGRMIRGL